MAVLIVVTIILKYCQEQKETQTIDKQIERHKPLFRNYYKNKLSQSSNYNKRDRCS